MARIRTIKPEFFTSDDICALSPLARLLYVGLWCEADRDGRLVWTPGVMKRRYLPDDACDIEVLGAELVGRGLIRLYGEGLACIPSFARHQHVNIREAQSKLPPPPGEVQAQLPLGREEGKEREGEGTEDGARAHAMPQDWKPDDGDLAWAATARPDLDRGALEAESERFRNHAAANRRTAHRWGPAWRIWISKAHPPAARPPSGRAARTATIPRCPNARPRRNGGPASRATGRAGSGSRATGDRGPSRARRACRPSCWRSGASSR